jgi:integrase
MNCRLSGLIACLLAAISLGTCQRALAQTTPRTTQKNTSQQAPLKADQSAIDKAIADLGSLMKELNALDESDKEIARSNRLQIETTQLLDRRENKIMHEDLPALKERSEKHDQERQRIIASGCAEEAGMVPKAVADRCNPLIHRSNEEQKQLTAELLELRKEKDDVDNERATVSATTYANGQKQKANNARRDELLAEKKQLEAKLLDLKNKTTACAKLLRQRGITCEKIKLRCGMVHFDGSDPEPYRTMAYVAGCLGLRVSEIVGLQWGDIDFERLEVTIRRKVALQTVGKVKTTKSAATLPLDPQMATILLDHRRCLDKAPKPSDWLFPSPVRSDMPLSPTHVQSKHIAPLAKKVTGEDAIGWHNFRHTYSTLLRELGADIKVQQELLRHSDVRTTLNIYTQGSTAQKREANSKVVSILVSGREKGAPGGVPSLNAP